MRSQSFVLSKLFYVNTNRICSYLNMHPEIDELLSVYATSICHAYHNCNNWYSHVIVSLMELFTICTYDEVDVANCKMTNAIILYKEFRAMSKSNCRGFNVDIFNNRVVCYIKANSQSTFDNTSTLHGFTRFIYEDLSLIVLVICIVCFVLFVSLLCLSLDCPFLMLPSGLSRVYLLTDVQVQRLIEV